MEALLSPKQVARAMDVSESSLKRWCDQGLLPTQRTAGGHRRLPIEGVMRFLRDTGRTLVRPEVLGLPSTTGRGEAIVERSARLIQTALQDGDEDAVRQTVFDLYLARHSLSDICDKVIAAAFRGIGDAWECHELEVYQERRACEICLRVLHELRSIVPLAPTDAPRAIGGTLSGDYYQLPTAMVQLVLREQGWRATSLGTNLPAATLVAAIERTKPQLFWLSVSHVAEPEHFVAAYSGLYEAARARGVSVVVGGRALTAELRKAIDFTSYCDQLRHLQEFAKTLHAVNGEP